MASKYGYMAKIGADTSGLQDALKSVEADARNITAELRAVNEGLKFDPGNTNLLNRRYELLAESIDNTRKKLEQLKSAEDAVNAAVARGDISVAEQQRYQREIANTESTLNARRSLSTGHMQKIAPRQKAAPLGVVIPRAEPLDFCAFLI